MKHLLVVGVLGGVVGMFSCGGPTDEQKASDASATEVHTPNAAAQTPDSVYIQRGKRIAQESFQALRSYLIRAMEEGGVSRAIEVCAGKAIPLLDSLSRVHGVRITRVSHKPRNPANAADSAEVALIQRYEADRKAGKSWHPKLQRTSEGVIFYAPIAIKFELCLKCHGQPGTDIAEEDYILIRQYYPQDQAVGFWMEDVRGLWKITFAEES